MVRVLVVCEEYNELVFLETLLKKIGFDVIGVQKENHVSDQLMSFNPEVVLAGSSNKSAGALKVAQKVKRRNGLPKLILMFPQAYMPSAQQLVNVDMDLLLEAPIEPRKLLVALGRLSSVDENTLLQKFDRLNASGHFKDVKRSEAAPVDKTDLNRVRKSTQESVAPAARFPIQPPMAPQVPSEPKTAATPAATSVTVSTPASRPQKKDYREFTRTFELPQQNYFSNRAILEYQREAKEFRKSTDLKKLDESKKEFVKALFKK